jgi:hypothetical protein
MCLIVRDGARARRKAESKRKGSLTHCVTCIYVRVVVFGSETEWVGCASSADVPAASAEAPTSVAGPSCGALASTGSTAHRTAPTSGCPPRPGRDLNLGGQAPQRAFCRGWPIFPKSKPAKGGRHCRSDAVVRVAHIHLVLLMLMRGADSTRRERCWGRTMMPRG